MQPLPALTSQSLAARYATDSAAITKAAASAKRMGDPALAHALGALRGRHFLSFDPRGPGEAIEVSATSPPRRGWRFSCPAPTRPWRRSVPGARPRSGRGRGPRRAGTPAGPGRPPRGRRLARLQHPRHLSPGVLTSGDAGQGASALRPFVTHSPGTGPASPCCATARDGRLRPGRVAPARHRHRGVRQPRDGRFLGAAAAHQRPGSGAGAAATGSATCPTSSCSGSASAPTPPPPRSVPARSAAAPAGTAVTSARAGRRCATWPHRPGDPAGVPDDPPRHHQAPRAGRTDRRRHAAAPRPHGRRAPRPGHRRGHPRALAGHRAGAEPRPGGQRAARRQPAGLAARPHPGVVDLSDTSPSSSSSAATPPPAATPGTTLAGCARGWRGCPARWRCSPPCGCRSRSG